MEHTRNTESFIATRRSLEEAFFLEQDRDLIERKSQLHRMEKTKGEVFEREVSTGAKGRAKG